MKLHHMFLVIIGIIISPLITKAQNVEPESIQELEKKIEAQENQQKPQEEESAGITFNYHNEELVDIINQFAALKHINILFPTGEQSIKSKVTLSIQEKLSIDQAWEIILTLLEISGYTMIQKGNRYTIVRTDKDITKEPLPLYIGTSLEELPDSDERIRYVHYLTNISAVPESNSELMTILKEILPSDASFQVDANSNALIIADKASNIKSVMHIINTIDRSEYQEKPQIIQLRHVSAELVTRLFREHILKQERKGPRGPIGPVQESAATYFPEHIKIMPYARTNSLIIMGKKQAIERVKHFIFKYLDVELDSGKSILHIYHLQYLDAQKFAPTLRQIVTSSKSGGTGQSQGAAKAGGTERFFDEVIIQADIAGEMAASTEDGVASKKYGGNKLIIACRSEDWKRIRKLIEQLDTPQPQVIIEVLIADLTMEDTRLLGSLLRNPAAVPLQGNMSFQSAQLQGVVLDNPPNATVASDLLRQAFDNDTVSVAGLATPGSTIVSLNDNDGRTWSIFQLLNLFNHRKVLSHPHVIATDHHTAEITIGETRLVPDEATTSGNQATRKKKPITAELKIKITPHISGDSVVLGIDIDINEFTNTNPESGNANQITRELRTNATVKNKAILALGGLTRIDTQKNRGITPLLGEIPVIGWFFKQRSNRLNKTNLTVFIQPTIVLPRLRGGVGEYTNQQLQVVNTYTLNGVLFENLRDPITRWYFAPEEEGTHIAIQNFVAKDEFKREAEFVEYPAATLPRTTIVPENDDEARPEPEIVEVVQQEKQTDLHEVPVAPPVAVVEAETAPKPDPRSEQLKQLARGKPNPLFKTDPVVS